MIVPLTGRPPLPKQRAKPRRFGMAAQIGHRRLPLRDKDRLAWLRRQPCALCRKYGLKQATPTEAAHTGPPWALDEGGRRWRAAAVPGASPHAAGFGACLREEFRPLSRAGEAMTNPLDETFRQIREIWEQLPPEMREKAVRRTSYPAEWDFEDVKEYEDRHA